MSVVEQLLARRGLLDGFRRHGRRLFGPCPVHGGDNPRAFVVDLPTDRWYCFTRCCRGGGPVALARALDLPVEHHGLAPTQPPQPFIPYRRRLHLDPRAPALAARGIQPAIARQREVGAWHGGGMLEGCIAFQLHDPDGQPLGYAGRRLDPTAATTRGKWVFPPRLPKADLLYGLHHVRQRSVVLTECPWGVLRLAQLGIDAVALLGVALSQRQLRLLDRFERVVALMDGDPAGAAAAQRVQRRIGARATILDLPPGADPDDLQDADLDALVRPSFLMEQVGSSSTRASRR